MLPCQIKPEPSTEVIRSTAWIGWDVFAAGGVFRLNIRAYFTVETKRTLVCAQKLPVSLANQRPNGSLITEN
jgi:hypothetical protein